MNSIGSDGKRKMALTTIAELPADRLVPKVPAARSHFRLGETSSLALHLVRGVSAQMVVIGHGMSLFELRPLPFIQASAVLIFFLLSGFVIPYSTFKKVSEDKRYGFAAYVIDRFSRIFVGFIPGIFVVLLLDLLSRVVFPDQYRYGDAFDVRTFLGNLLMLQDWPALGKLGSLARSSAFGISCFGSGRPFWTVAVEWWIYLGFGWIAFAGLRSFEAVKRPGFWLVCIPLLIVPLHNLIGGLGNGLTLVWLLGLGVYALISRGYFKIEKASGLSVAALFSALALFRIYETRVAYDMAFALLLASSFYFGVSALQSSDTQLPGLVRRAITSVADYSYTIYLVHYSVLDFLVHLRGRHSDLSLLVAGFVLSNAFSLVLFHMCERHYHVVGTRLKKALL